LIEIKENALSPPHCHQPGVHDATIVEINVESYRRKAALKRERGKGD
jgi:hypothetical protein